MNKNKDNRKSFFRLAAIATVLLLAFLFLRKDNIFRWIQSAFTIRSQEKRIEYLEKDNARMDERLKDLTTDRDTLETYARERFDFSAPGETVYKVE